MDYSRFSSRGRIESTFLENSQHREVFRQDLGGQFFESGITGQRAKMPHQCGADALSLVFVDQGESYFSSSGLNDNVATTTYDVWSSAFFCDDDQATWLTSLTFEKNSISCSVKWRFTEKKRRRSDSTLARPMASSRPLRSSFLSARISTRRPSAVI